ncbi:hypothetical protein [Ligilactobacillus salivarius]|uniref:hypothetical protein n=1 Tax=Ligilactobacillus salivarius TaxID=1624 RepID=UPI003669FF91
MENNLFVAVMLGCGTNDLGVFFERLDRYEDTVFLHDEEFSYEKLIEETKFRAGNDYGLNDLMETLDYMAVDSALGQVTQSEKFDEFNDLVFENLRWSYNYSYIEFYFDDKEGLKKFDEWKEFSELLGL